MVAVQSSQYHCVLQNSICNKRTHYPDLESAYNWALSCSFVDHLLIPFSLQMVFNIKRVERRFFLVNFTIMGSSCSRWKI
jgi:hypothetical protein